jgi:hypothetical protein
MAALPGRGPGLEVTSRSALCYEDSPADYQRWRSEDCAQWVPKACDAEAPWQKRQKIADCKICEQGKSGGGSREQASPGSRITKINWRGSAASSDALRHLPATGPAALGAPSVRERPGIPVVTS